MLQTRIKHLFYLIINIDITRYNKNCFACDNNFGVQFVRSVEDALGLVLNLSDHMV